MNNIEKILVLPDLFQSCNLKAMASSIASIALILRLPLFLLLLTFPAITVVSSELYLLMTYPKQDNICLVILVPNESPGLFNFYLNLIVIHGSLLQCHILNDCFSPGSFLPVSHPYILEYYSRDDLGLVLRPQHILLFKDFS